MRYPRFALVPLLATLAVVACDAARGPTAVEPETGSEPEPEVASQPWTSPISMKVEGYTTPGEVRSGWIFNRYGNAVEVEYELHDGLAIWEGDIVIGEAGEVPGTRDELYARAAAEVRSEGNIQAGVVTSIGSEIWPGGVIPYTISTSAPPTQSVVDDAIAIIENETPGIDFVLRTTESDYVTFQDGGGCSSSIGRQGGQQFITLKVWDGTSWCSEGNGAHEILHTVGMYHEHSRCDRDGFVTIDYDAVISGYEHNFYKAGSTTEGGGCSNAYDIDDYDFESIMHYPLDAFGDPDGTQTIFPIIDVTGLNIGQRNGLGPTDLETVVQLYGANNAAPVVPAVYPTGDLLEGSVLNFDASATNGTNDPDDSYDILTFEWTFGDGTCPGPAACTEDAPDHTYADNGDYGYNVIVGDGFLEAGFASNVTILNVAPDVAAGADVTMDEGDDFARSGSFTDPGADSWDATVDYGDGGGAQALTLSGKSFSLAHTYMDNGVNTVVVTVTDDDGGEGSDEVEVTVLNVAPTVDPGPDAIIDEGSLFSQSGSFTDPGADTWTATVDYGDGGGPEALILSGKSFSLAHTYVDNGVNTVAVTVTDDDGGAGSGNALVTVLNVAPTVEAGPDATVESGQLFTLSGTFSDPGIEDDPWTWMIDWGYGPVTSGQTNDQSAPIEASQQTCAAGSYLVSLTVTDKDGGSGTDALTLTVPYMTVDIDIMPGSAVNPIGLKKRGNLPVAILGSAAFDASSVDPATLVLGDEADPDIPVGQKKNGMYEAYLEDVNGDGYMDLVAMFPTQDLVAQGELTEFSTELVLRSFLLDGCTNIRGADSVRPE